MLRAADDQWYMSMESILMRDRFRSFETSKRLWKEGADARETSDQTLRSDRSEIKIGLRASYTLIAHRFAMNRKHTGAATHHSKADTDRHIHGALWGANGRAEILDDHSTLVIEPKLTSLRSAKTAIFD
jgi:hypothetical protein